MNHEIRYHVTKLTILVRVVARCTCGLSFEQRGMSEEEAREKLKDPVNLHMRETRA